MKILIVHNSYAQYGGEDAVVDAEVELLSRHGHEVYVYRRNNTAINRATFFRKISFIKTITYSKRTYREITSLINEFKPDIAHFHNIFFLITPSAYRACKDAGVPIVQTLHNFRLRCLNGLFFRNGKSCELCITGNFKAGNKYRCYDRSAIKSAILSNMINYHWKNRTWLDMVDRYVALSPFSLEKFKEMGLPASKISYKPNFETQYLEKSKKASGKYFLFVGRLSEEKGPQILVKEWKNISDWTLKIAGDGPLKESLVKLSKNLGIKNIEWLGSIDSDKVNDLIREAKAVIIPSICYENFPHLLAKAWALHVPVIASRIGSLESIISDRKTGLLFNPLKTGDLGCKIKELVSATDFTKSLIDRIKLEYNEKYTDIVNYQQLMEIYSQVSLT